MSVGLLLITHNQIGDALLDAATAMIGVHPLPTRTLPVILDSDTEQITAQASKLVQELHQSSGVLILTDMFGSTPSNIAASLLKQPHVMVVAGINLPMLIRVLN